MEVSVTDSGAGISPEHHQEIFEDFVRVDRNTSGMGLGLAIAKRLVQAHRGKIWVHLQLLVADRAELNDLGDFGKDPCNGRERESSGSRR